MHPSSQQTVAHLTEGGLLSIARLAARLAWLLPLVLVLLKIGDRCVGNWGVQPWWWFPLSGTLGKFDDLSFLVTLAGLSACILIAAAASELHSSRHPTETGWPIRRAAVSSWFLFSGIGIAVYLVGAYLTDGTFWHPAPKSGRVFQVPEGLLNIILVLVLYAFTAVGWHCARVVELRTKHAGAGPLDDHTMRAAEYLVNVTFAFVIAVVVLYTTLAALYFGSRGLAGLLGVPSLDLAKSFGFSPLSGLQGKLITMAFVIAIMYWPLLFFAWRMRKVLPSRVKWRLNFKVEVKITLPTLAPDVKVTLRVPRLVVFTLVELKQSTGGA